MKESYENLLYEMKETCSNYEKQLSEMKETCSKHISFVSDS
jgi:hypothetical protein